MTASKAAAITAGRPAELSQEAFTARLHAFGDPLCFAIAVSGGRDSMALACLSADYANQTGADILALTVDHRLRPEAAGEAAKAKQWCEALGLKHRTLCWDGDKPTSGIQEAARAARYRLLIKAAEIHSASALMTAHTLDDQAETFFMRLSRGGGARGLSAMREQSLVAAGAGTPMSLLRPLLEASREDVTAYLKARGQNYTDDPSNLDDRYERVRIRALLAALSEQDLLTAEALAASARKLADADRAARAQQEALFENLGGCFHPWGGISLDRWADAPGAAGLARRLIYAAGGGMYAPEEENALAAVERARNSAATLGGALLRPWNGRLWVMREPAALLGRAGVPAMSPEPLKAPILWDRRFLISPDSGRGLAVGPLGEDAQTALGPQASLFYGPPEGLYAQPGLNKRGVLIGAPALPFMGVKTAMCQSLAAERFEGRIIRF